MWYRVERCFVDIVCGGTYFGVVGYMECVFNGCRLYVIRWCKVDLVTFVSNQKKSHTEVNLVYAEQADLHLIDLL